MPAHYPKQTDFETLRLVFLELFGTTGDLICDHAGWDVDPSDLRGYTENSDLVKLQPPIGFLGDFPICPAEVGGEFGFLHLLPILWEERGSTMIDWQIVSHESCVILAKNSFSSDLKDVALNVACYHYGLDDRTLIGI